MYVYIRESNGGASQWFYESSCVLHQLLKEDPLPIMVGIVKSYFHNKN